MQFESAFTQFDSKELENWMSWSCTHVQALTIGPRMADVVKPAAFLKQERDRSIRETAAKWQRGKADRFHLD